MKIKSTKTDRADVYQVDDVAEALPSELREGETAEGTAVISIGVAEFIERIEHNVPVYRDDALPAENARALPALRQAMKTAISLYAAEAKAFSAADAIAREPAPLRDAAWEAEVRSRIAAMPIAARVTAVANLDFASSSALLRYADMDRLDLPQEVVEQVRHHHAVNGHLERSGLRANYARRPTFADPLATGVDEAAAFAAAEAVLTRHRQRGERLELAADALRGVARLAAAATGKRVDAVWAELTA